MKNEKLRMKNDLLKDKDDNKNETSEKQQLQILDGSTPLTMKLRNYLNLCSCVAHHPERNRKGDKDNTYFAEG